jgi:hypothetical protein
MSSRETNTRNIHRIADYLVNRDEDAHALIAQVQSLHDTVTMLMNKVQVLEKEVILLKVGTMGSGPTT